MVVRKARDQEIKGQRKTGRREAGRQESRLTAETPTRLPVLEV